MSAADTYVQDLARLREIETALRKELNQHQAEEARALEDALRQLMLANQMPAPSRRESHSSAAQRARQKAIEAGRMALEVIQRTEEVRAYVVPVARVVAHATPSTSCRLIFSSPSLILPFTVPTGSCSSSAICVCVKPPK